MTLHFGKLQIKYYLYQRKLHQSGMKPAAIEQEVSKLLDQEDF